VRVVSWVAAVCLTAVAAAAQTPESDAPPEPRSEHDLTLAPIVDPGAALPDDPAKVLVYARCNHCHGLEWIARSGGSEEGWRSRLRRMNRAGAMIPAEEMPVLAAYLAKALPERLRPPPPPKRGASPRRR
jgi:cytochrome c5